MSTSNRKNQCLINLRKKFVVPEDKIQQKHIEAFTNHLRGLTILELKIIDSTFFKELYQRTKSLSKIQIQKAKLHQKEFVKLLEAKMYFFNDFISTYFESLKNYSAAKNKSIISHITFLNNEETKIRTDMMPSISKFLEIFYLNSRMRPFELSRSYIEKIRVPSDHDYLDFLKQQIQKLMPVSIETSKKKNEAKISRKQQHSLYFEQKNFTQKMLIKIKELDQKYNPMHKQNLKIFTLFATNLDQMKKNISIQQLVPSKCINCVQFFYKDLAFHDQRNSLVDYEIIPSVKSIKKSGQRDHILETITAFLNKGSGTLIFDCDQTPYGFIPKGFEMTLKEQQSLKYSFENLFKFIRQESYQKSIESQIDFIPLKANPSQSTGEVINDPRQPYVARQYVRSWYVMRVKIRSKNQKEFFGCQIDYKTYYYIRKNKRNCQIEGEEVYRQNQLKYLLYFKCRSDSEMKNLKNSTNQNDFELSIHCRKDYPKNFHEGQCKQTLILTNTPSNIKNTPLNQSSNWY